MEEAVQCTNGCLKSHPNLFNDEPFKKFTDARCDDIDLTAISRKIANHHATSAVGTCLRLEGKVIQEIEQDVKCPRCCDKIHRLLIEWKNGNGNNGLWVDLIGCLQHLDNNSQLMEEIRGYLHQKKEPNWRHGTCVSMETLFWVTNLQHYTVHNIVITTEEQQQQLDAGAACRPEDALQPCK